MKRTAMMDGRLRRLSWVASLWLATGTAFASHEDFGFGGRSAAMGEAVTAVGDDAGAVTYNPALAYGIVNPQVQTGVRRGFHFPGGASDHRQLELAAGAPLRSFPWRGGLVAHSRSTTVRGVSLDRSHGLTYATHGWRETDNGVIDWGVTLKSLTRSGHGQNSGSVSKAGVDIGALYRIRERFVVAAAIINVNGPRTDIGGRPDRAPVMARLGFAQIARGFTMSLDGVRREPSGGRRATLSVASGVERWVHTGRIGAVAVRSGLNLGDQARTWTLGAGWRALGAQLDYALLTPLSSGSQFGHAVSLIFRFGSWDPDKEFERLLGSEIRYRQELARALDSAEVKQWRLAEELRRLRRELEDLQVELNTRTSSEADAQKKVRAAREKIRSLEERVEEDQRALDQIEKERKAAVEKPKSAMFEEDWRTYHKLKLQGTSDVVLLETIKRILRQYKDTGVDLSEANSELRRLLRTN